MKSERRLVTNIEQSIAIGKALAREGHILLNRYHDYRKYNTMIRHKIVIYISDIFPTHLEELIMSVVPHQVKIQNWNEELHVAEYVWLEPLE